MGREGPGAVDRYHLRLSGRARRRGPAPSGALGPAEGLALDQFAHNEMGGAPLGDVRLATR